MVMVWSLWVWLDHELQGTGSYSLLYIDPCLFKLWLAKSLPIYWILELLVLSVVIDLRRIVILSYLLLLIFLTRIRNHYVDLQILSYFFCPSTLTIVLYFFIYLKKETSFFRIGDMISFVFYFWELGIIFFIQ